ncbi:MAG: hypothetical protein RBT75_04140 [Anaerolineae bacterium]|nr:hypothetical protein [Anaerolineae bacterium]
MTTKNSYFRSTLLPLVIIPVGGLVTLGLCYLLYLFIYNFVEIQFFPTDPTSVPAATIRRVYTLALLVLYWALLRTKIPDLLKATILIGPLAMFITTAILSFYEKPVAAMAAVVIIVAVCIFLLYRYKQPWLYYYAVAVTVLTAIALAWPKV